MEKRKMLRVYLGGYVIFFSVVGRLFHDVTVVVATGCRNASRKHFSS